MENVQSNLLPSGTVVLGMHRSGTSAFTGLLVKAGFFAGKNVDLLPGAADNPTGFFERFDVIDLNDAMLAELGGSWDNPPKRRSVPDPPLAWQAKAETLLARLAVDAGGKPVVVKDPRMSLLLDVWLPALGDRFAVVLVDRNPVNLAMSLHKRDGRPVAVTLALWQLYYAELLDRLAGRTVWFARYESLLQTPTEYTAALLDALRASLVPNPASVGAGGLDTDRTIAAAFVTSEQRKPGATRPGPELEQPLTAGQLALSRWLSQLPEGWVTLDAPPYLKAQPHDALECAGEYHARVGPPPPAPVTARGALRLAHHHFHEGGLSQLVRRGGSLAVRLVRSR